MPVRIERLIHDHFLAKDLFFTTKIDDYLKSIPFAVVFACHICGIKTRSSWKKQILTTAGIEAIRYVMINTLKNCTSERRPAPYSDKRSFPSGHTSSSFAGAAFMHQELKESLPVWSYTGYAGALSVAVIRLMKSRHWLKDVIAGAVLGVLATKTIYALVSVLHHQLSKSKENAKSSLSLQDQPELPDTFNS